MRCIDFGAAAHPALNLAREEHLLARLAANGALLLFYINTDAVIIGRNQVPWAEVTAATLATSGLPLVRRMSGGGAVYHDPGNLNFSILLQAAAPGRPDAADILQPVRRALQSLGLPARLSKRNAIFVDRHKVSGTAQYMTAGKILTHGTLLVDTDLNRLQRCLTPDPAYQVESRGRSSVRRPVTNLQRLRPDITIDVLRRSIQQAFAVRNNPSNAEALGIAEERAALSLAEAKYQTWAWNVGRSPHCRIGWEGHFQGQHCACRLDIRRGVVVRVAVTARPNWQGHLQWWAENFLCGRRLSALPGIAEEGDEWATKISARRAFQRWLGRHLPAAMP